MESHGIIAMMLLLTLIWFTALPTPVSAADDYDKVNKLLETDTTIQGETIHYPESGAAKIVSLIITMDPGESTGWHKHGTPLYAYMLEGKLTVDYGKKGRRTYQAGESFMEAMDYWHQGSNNTVDPVRILVVFMGAEGYDNVIHKP